MAQNNVKIPSKSDMELIHKLEQFIANPLKHKSRSSAKEFIEGLCAIEEKHHDYVKNLYMKSDDYFAIMFQHIDEKYHILLWTAMLQLHCCYENNDQTDYCVEKMLRYVESHGLSVFIHGEKDQFYDFIQSLHDYADLKSESEMNENERNEVFGRIEQILEKIDITGKSYLLT